MTQNFEHFSDHFFPRFYTALALQELVNEKSISEVAVKYKINRGVLQNLQQSAATFAGVVTTFCKSLGADWNLLALILTQFRERLFFGIHPDLMDLMKIPSMSSTRIARALFKSGLEKLSDLANSKALKVENVLMDLGGNFFVSGKSTEINANELAKLLIKDARNHVECEMGLKKVEWRNDGEEKKNDETSVNSVESFKVEDSKNEESVNKTSQERQSASESRKRKAETQLKSRESSPESSKKSKIDVTEYKRKLRSSGGAKDFKIPNPIISPDSSLFDLDTSTSSTSSSLLELTQQFLTIIDVLASPKLFELFKQEVLQQKVIGMSIGVKKFEVKSQKIGGNLLNPEVTVGHNFTFDSTFYIECLSFCYNGNRICQLNMQTDDANTLQEIKNFLHRLLTGQDVTLNIYEAREGLKTLLKAMNMKDSVSAKISDPRIASWLIDPDTTLTWHEMVTKFAPNHLEILELATKHMTRSSLGLAANSTVEPKIRTAVESFLANSLLQQQIQSLKTLAGNEKLLRVFHSLEMKIQVVLAKMELTGLPINVQKLQSSIEDATMLQRKLEQRIFELHGRKFNLSSSKEVSKVVGIHKNLQTKKKVSTKKNVLEKLDLPIANLIMTWRTLDKTISNMQPKMKMVKGARIHGNSFSLTQTGRISMLDPNLQNVTKDFEVEVKGELWQTLSLKSY